jgi:hypothetical protein
MSRSAARRLTWTGLAMLLIVGFVLAGVPLVSRLAAKT